jgi:hypothetical protein
MNTATMPHSPPSKIVSILRQSPLPDLRRLLVEETEFEVIISGTVSSYYLKQLAQETIRTALARRRLRNRVVVAPKSKR